MHKHRINSNVLVLYKIQSILAFGMSFAADLVTFYAEALGIVRALIGVISGFNQLASISSEMIWAYLSDKLAKRKIFLILGITAWTLLWLPILMTKNQALFIILVLTQAFLVSMAIPTFNALIIECTTKKNRLHVLTNLSILDLTFAFLAAIIASLLAKILFEHYHLINFHITRIMFVITGSVTLISILFMTKLKDPKLKKEKRNLFLVSNQINKFFFTTDIKRFFISNILFSFAIGIPSGFLSIYVINDLNASMSFFIATNAIYIISGLITLRIWEKFAKKTGYKKTLVAAVSLTTAGIAFYLFSYHYLITANIILGVGWAGFNVVSSAMLMNYLPKKDNAEYLGMFDVYKGVAFFIAPIIGGIMAEFYSIWLIIVLSLSVRIITIPFFISIKEPEQIKNHFHRKHHYQK